MAKKKEEPQEEKKKGGALKWIVILLLLLGLAGGGAFAYFKYIEPILNGDSKGTEEATPEKKEEEEEAKNTVREMVSLPPLVVNLADPLGRRYLKVGIDVEVNTLEGVEKVQAGMAQIKDTLLLLLSSKTYADLASISNKLALKTEIVARMNQVMNDAFITQVYFTEFVIQ